MERDQLADILHRTQDQQEDDMMRLQQHLELQLKQQLQQQYRQVRKVLPTSFLPFVAYFFARVGGVQWTKIFRCRVLLTESAPTDSAPSVLGDFDKKLHVSCVWRVTG